MGGLSEGRRRTRSLRPRREYARRYSRSNESDDNKIATSEFQLDATSQYTVKNNIVLQLTVVDVFTTEHAEGEEEEVSVQTAEAEVAAFQQVLALASFFQHTVEGSDEVVSHDACHQTHQKPETRFVMYFPLKLKLNCTRHYE